MADVKIMKLVSSEEIICDLVEEKEDCYVVKNPFCIAPTLSSSAGKVSVFPWSLATMQFSETEYSIGKQFVMLFADAPESLAASYIGQVTGLSVPTGGLITG
jgi:hypothetical protein